MFMLNRTVLWTDISLIVFLLSAAFLSFDRIKRKFERFSLFEVKGEGGGKMAFTLCSAQI